MRVVAGRLGGRTFEAPSGHRTHPMSDKVRGALFNILGDVSGLTVLDAFSGSGALSIEALSRGAAFATAVEIDPTAVKVIKNNINRLDLDDSAKVINANIGSWSTNNPDVYFDLVICDPPYRQVQPEIAVRLAGHVKNGGVVVYSLPPSMAIKLPEHYKQLTSKNYGDATLVFYRRTE